MVADDREGLMGMPVPPLQAPPSPPQRLPAQRSWGFWPGCEICSCFLPGLGWRLVPGRRLGFRSGNPSGGLRVGARAGLETSC